jgi:hypothetical protein
VRYDDDGARRWDRHRDLSRFGNDDCFAMTVLGPAAAVDADADGVPLGQDCADADPLVCPDCGGASASRQAPWMWAVASLPPPA